MSRPYRITLTVQIDREYHDADSAERGARGIRRELLSALAHTDRIELVERRHGGDRREST